MQMREVLILFFLVVAGLAGALSIPSTPAAGPSPQAGGKDPMQGDSRFIVYIANEGVLIETLGKKVVMDGMFRHLAGYPRPSDAARADMENARSAFAGVDLVLATHHHADHFDAKVAGAHLAANPKATFVSARQVADDLAKGAPRYSQIASRVLEVTPDMGQRKDVRVADMGVSVLRLRHGNTMNVGFLLNLDGIKVLHLGDSDGTVANFDAFDLQKEGIDFALAPYWYALDEESRRVIREHIAAKQVIFFHIPEDNPDDSYLQKHMQEMGGRAGLTARIKKEFPQAMFLLTAGAPPSR